MPSTYSSNLKLELMATGENSGTWGNITNTNLGTAAEQAIVGYGSVVYASDANLTISITNSNAAQAARALVLNVTSSLSLTGTRELVVPTIEKQYIVQNNTTGSQSITVKTSAGTGITVPNGRKAHLYVDGTNVIQMFDFVDINGGTIDGTAIGGSSAAAGSFTTLGASGAATFNGAVTLGDAAADLIVFNGTVNSHLLFTDNTYDIGASGATRPRNLFLAGAATIGGNLSVGGTLTLTGGLILNGNVTVGDSSADTLTVNATITSNLLFTDNTYDIGASGATRPRNLFLAGNATIGGNTTMTGSLTVDSTTDSTSTITGSIQTDGGLGVAKALYVGTTVNVGGLTSGRVTYATTNGRLTDNASLTFDGTTLFAPNFWSSGDGQGLTLRNTANTGGGVITAITGTSGGLRISSDAGPMILESGGATTLTLSNAQGATFAGAVTLNAGTANGVAYLNASKVLTTGSALTFDGTTLGVNGGLVADANLLVQINSPAAGQRYFASNKAGAYGLLMGYDTSSDIGRLRVIPNTAMTFEVNNTEGMRLTSTGLGLNQTAPICKLDVREGNRVNSSNIGNVGVYTTNNPAIDLGGTIALGGRFAVASPSEAPFASIRGAKENSTDNNYNGYLAFQTIQNGNVLTERVRISSSGFTGFNTTNPNAPIHVLAADATTADLARFQQTNQGNLLIQSQQGGQNIGGTNGILFSNAVGAMGWRTNASSGSANMLLTTGGDLGLGTVSPSAKFHAEIPAVTNSNVEMLRLTDGTYADFKVLLNRSTTLGASLARLNTATNNMGFETANTERMRLVSSELIIGGTSTGYGVGSTRQTNVASSTGIVTGLVLQNSANNPSGQGVALYFKNSIWNGGGIEDAKAAYIKYYSAGNYSEQGNLAFGTNNGYGVAPIDRMLLTYDGSLYVGETNANWAGQAGITLGQSTTSLNAKNFIRINNRGNGGTNTSHTIGGIVWSAYRDVRNPSDVAAIWAIRTSYAGGLASDGTLVFGTEQTDGGSIEVDGSLPQERARITTEGNFFLGDTTGAARLSVNGNGPSGYNAQFNQTVTNNNVVLIQGTSSSTAQNYVVFAVGSTVTGTIQYNGSTVAYNTTSDYRLKENVVPVTGAFARIGSLEPVEYDWKRSGIRSRGFLAHKFQEVYPQSVSGAKDAVDAKGKPVYQTMQASTSEVIADLVACIQELKAEFDAYKATHP